MTDRLEQLDNIPQQMKELPNWLLWKLVQKEDKPKPTKIPFHTETFQACDPTSAGNWVMFGHAHNIYKKNFNSFNGLGFCLSKETGICFVDLDDCLDEQGHLEPWAVDVLDQLPRSFVEISQSGKGLHYFAKGLLPGTGKKVHIPNGGVLEMYDCNRYAAVTGNIYLDCPAVLQEAQEAIVALYERYFKEEPAEEELIIEGEVGNHLTDAELLQLMFENPKKGKTIKALWNGDISGHNQDESSADMALLAYLAFWTNRDAEQMENLFSQSVLGERNKWQKREDYRRRSINAAIRKCKNGYNPSPPPKTAQTKSRSPFVPTIITGLELMQKEFIPPTYVVPGLLSEGLGILAGKPKAGKSWLALSLALSVATGGFFLRRQLKKGKVLYAALEDNQRRLQGRIDKLKKDDDVFEDLLLICEMPRLHDGGLEFLREVIASHPDLRLLIIDTLQRVKPPAISGKNAYEQDYEALIPLQLLALESKIAIQVITHLRKQKADDKFDQITGTLGLSGAADCMWVLHRGRNEGIGILSVTGRDIEEQELHLKFEQSTCKWQSNGNAHIHFASEERRKVHEFLKKHGLPASPQEVADALGQSVGSLRHIMPKMVDEGFLIKVTRGKYEAVIQEEEQDVY